jgi:prolyl-tRNA synthetase
MQEISTPGIKGVEQLAKFLKVDVTNTVKTMIYKADELIIAVAVRGDYEVNEIKLRTALQVKSVELADELTIKNITKAEVGYAGLIGLPKEVNIIADDSIEPLVNFEMGANKTDYHNINVNWERDLRRPERFYDIKQAKIGDIHPETGVVYEVFNGVEVGNIFPLESKFSDALDLYYSDEQGKQKSIIMGSYGIGVSRLMGVLAEHFSDDKGLVWPKNVAPYLVYIAQIGDNEVVNKQAEDLYNNLNKIGIEVLWDDRSNARPGEKFADADLYGIPYRIVVSSKTNESGLYELKERTKINPELVNYEQLLALLAKQ